MQLVVAAAGSGQAAAEHRHRYPGWVTQRLNLLKLIPELHAALRAGEIPLREVRTLHTIDPDGQRAALRRFTAVNRHRAADDTTEPETTPAPEPGERPTPTARAIRRLGGTPDKIAAALKAELAPHEIDQLVQHLTTAASATTRSA